MTWQEAGVRLVAIGERSARFRDLILSFAKDNEPVESVIWLPNGGGKSSLMSLRAAVVLPNSRDFTGAGREDGEKRPRRLDDYIGNGDTSHTVISWVADDDTSLIDEPQRLLTGAVYEWPSRRRPADGEQSTPNKMWWSAVPRPGLLDLAELPVRAGGRQLTLSEFQAQMIALNTEHPDLQFQFARTQSEWERQLTLLRIDTQLARYQARMNTSEGGISKVFRFNSTQDFINLVVDVICPPKDATDVAGVLSAHAANLFRRPALLAERTFLTEAHALLVDLASWQDLVDEANSELRTTESAAARLRQSLVQAASDHRTRAAIADDRVVTHEEMATHARRRRAQVDRLRAELRRRAALDLHKRAQDALRKVEREEKDALRKDALWFAAGHFAEGRAHRARRDEVLELLTPERREREDLRVRHDVTAHAVRQLLRGQADEQASAENAAWERRESANAKLLEFTPQLTAARRELVDAQGEYTRAETLLGAHDEAMASAHLDGILLPQESPAQAVDRHTTAAREAAELATTLRANAVKLRKESRALAQQATTEAGKRGTQEAEVARASGALEDLRSRHARLTSDARLAALAETDEPDPWGDAPRLRAALVEAIRDGQSRVLSGAVEAASDERLLAGIEGAGLLPSPVATQSAVATLITAGMRAETAWDVLVRDFPEEARGRAASTRPDLATGVVLQATADRDRALTLLASAPALEHITLVTVADLTGAAQGAAPAAALPSVPLHAGLYDLVAASNAAVTLRDVSATRAGEDERLRSQAQTDTDLLTELTSFLDEHPSVESLAAARAALEGERAALTHLGEVIEQLNQNALLAEVNAQQLSDQAGEAQIKKVDHENLTRAAHRLREADSKVVGLLAERDHADSMIEQLTPRVSALEKGIDDAREEASAAEDSRKEAGRNARALRGQADQIAVLASDAAVDSDAMAAAASVGLTEAYARFQTLHQQWHNASTGSVLEERLANIETALVDANSAADTALAQFDGDKAKLRADAQDVAAHHDRSSCEQQSVEARVEVREQARLVEQARTALATAAARLDQAQTTARAARLRPDEQVTYTTPEQAEDDALALDAESTARASEETEMNTRADEFREQARDLRIDAEQFEHLTSLLPTRNDGTGDEVIEPFAGTRTAATEAVTRMRAVLDAAVADVGDAQEGRQGVTVRAVQLAGRPAFQGMRLTVKDRLAEGDPIGLGKLAASYAREVDTRMEQVSGLIEQVEKDRDRVTTVVAGKVRSLLKGISDASRASVLPAGLGQMSGNQFVSIKFDRPSEDELISRVGQEVMSLIDNASAKSLPTGDETLRKCVHAAVGNRRFNVSVLKPNEHMLAQRVPVVDVARFSDGEKLTTCVLLFCAFARMRHRGNDVGSATGTLMLDNPFGQASNAQLVALQLAVAKAQKVHLVYATGLEDMGALAQFRRLVRLRNRKTDDSTGFVQHNDQPRTGAVTGVGITRPDAPAATWQTSPQEMPQ